MLIKGKRTKRPRPASPLTPLPIDTTACRVATSSSSTTTSTNADSGSHICNSPSTLPTTTTEEEVDLAYSLILLAQGHHKSPNHQPQPSPLPMCTVYECKTCNRCFPSFQALGGHRASHKKPKHSPPEENHHHQSPENSKINSFQGVALSPHFAGNSSNTLSAINNHPKLKVHACGICGAEFSSGQALGGHMRRHRSPTASTPATLSASPEPIPARNLQLCLDLNLPADQQQDHQLPETQSQSPEFLFGSNDKTLVFTSSLVDCRY